MHRSSRRPNCDRRLNECVVAQAQHCRRAPRKAGDPPRICVPPAAPSVGDSLRLLATRGPCQPAVRNRISRLVESRPPVACARAGPARGGSQFPVLCTAREHPSNAFASRWPNELVAWICAALMMVTARIFSLLPFRPSPFHTGPGAGSGAGTAASIHRGVVSVVCFGPAVLVRSTDCDLAPCADGAGGGAVRTAGQIFAHRPRSAHSVELLSLRDSCLALLAASGCADVLGAPDDSRTASPAPVPFIRAHWLRLRKVSRRAFDVALQAGLAEVLRDFKARAAAALTPGDMWPVEHFLNQRRRELDAKYDYRYSQLISVFGRLIGEGRLTEAQLLGLSQDHRRGVAPSPVATRQQRHTQASGAGPH
jgi:hypothetical protein